MSQGQANLNFPITTSSKASLIFAGDYTAADEGSYFVATNPTPGTAIATSSAVVDDATGTNTHAQQKPVMYLQNQWPAGTNSQNVYLRYLKMVIAQIPTSATAWKYAMRLSPNTNKLTTAGTNITPVNPNGASGQLSKLFITFGAVTTTDSASDPGQRLVANGQIVPAVPVAGDEWLFTFGQFAQGFDVSVTSANVKRLTIPVPPIIIPPQWGMTLEMWGAANAAAPSWEFEMGYVERPAGQ